MRTNGAIWCVDKLGLLPHLSLDVVDEPLHAGLHAVRVLAWQQLRVPVAVQADAARQQLVELLHLEAGLRPCGRRSDRIRTLS